MKLSGRGALKFCAAPEKGCVGALIFGADAGQVTDARRRLISSILGKEPDDLRLTAVDAAIARRESAEVADALRAQGFFPGRRLVLIEGGTDGLAKPLALALEGLTEADAFLLVTADALPARSSLRKLFETNKQLASLQLFQDAPDVADISGLITAAGHRPGATTEAAEALATVGAALDFGSFQRFLETLALYASGRDTPITETDVAALAPLGLDGELDDMVGAVAGGRAEAIGPLMRRLEASGIAPVTVVLALQRHFRQLLAAESGGGIAAFRPPLRGPRRSAIEGQLRRWSRARLEQAARLLLETDARIRSAERPPERALLERCALRLAMMAGR